MKCISGIKVMFSNTVFVCVRRKYWRACVISRSDNFRWLGSMSAEIIPLISCSSVLDAGSPTGRSPPSTPRDQGLSVVSRTLNRGKDYQVANCWNYTPQSPTFIWPLTLITISSRACVWRGINWSQRINNSCGTSGVVNFTVCCERCHRKVPTFTPCALPSLDEWQWTYFNECTYSRL